MTISVALRLLLPSLSKSTLLSLEVSMTPTLAAGRLVTPGPEKMSFGMRECEGDN